MTAPRLVTLRRRCGRRKDPALVAQVLATGKFRLASARAGRDSIGHNGRDAAGDPRTAKHAAVESFEQALAVAFAYSSSGGGVALSSRLRCAISGARVLAEVGLGTRLAQGHLCR